MVVDSGFLPQVDLTGNFYTQSTGPNKGSIGDVTLSVNVPYSEDGSPRRIDEAHLLADGACRRITGRAVRHLTISKRLCRFHDRVSVARRVETVIYYGQSEFPHCR